MYSFQDFLSNQTNLIETVRLGQRPSGKVFALLTLFRQPSDDVHGIVKLIQDLHSNIDIYPEDLDIELYIVIYPFEESLKVKYRIISVETHNLNNSIPDILIKHIETSTYEL